MNEEDIKNLNEIIELCEEEINNNNENVTAILDLTDLKSLRNLINRNKELEEKVMQKDLEIIGVEEYTKASMGEIIEHYYTANKDCIPKSKVEEKIEELKQEYKIELEKNSIKAFILKCKIEALEELIQEGE